MQCRLHTLGWLAHCLDFTNVLIIALDEEEKKSSEQNFRDESVCPIASESFGDVWKYSTLLIDFLFG